MRSGFKTLSVGVALLARESDVFEVSRAHYGSFQMPAAIASANATIQFSIDGANFTDAEAAPQAVVADHNYQIPAKAFTGRYARIFMDTAEDPAISISVMLKTEPDN